MFKCSCRRMKCDEGSDAWNNLRISHIHVFLKNIRQHVPRKKNMEFAKVRRKNFFLAKMTFSRWKNLEQPSYIYIYLFFVYKSMSFLTPLVRRFAGRIQHVQTPRPHKLQDKNSWGPTEARQTPTELWFLCGWGWPPGTPQTWESTWGTRSPGCKVAGVFFKMC